MRPRRARRVLVLGGARSGKSRFAEQLVGQRAAVYVACGPAPVGGDAEWAQRVAAHRDRRPATWTTEETLQIEDVLATAGPPVLIDCLSTWLAGTMDAAGSWTGAPDADGALAARAGEVTAAWAGTRRRAVAVSNEVGSGVVPATASGRRFRDELGVLNARFAATADRVWLVTAGLPQRLK